MTHKANKEGITDLLVDLLKKVDGMPGNGKCTTCLHIDGKFCEKFQGSVPDEFLEKGCEEGWQAKKLSSEPIFIEEIPL